MNYAQPPMMPVAKALANQGRMSDSTLVHMNPQEVAGLQSLARQSGTSLTINPQTGLPEAFNLSSILPVIAGAALTPVMGPMGAAMAVGGLGALMSGSVEQGLMMGLGAYGGAGLAGSAANLAAPAAAAASAPTTAAIAAPSAIGGAAGASGLMASAAPATTLAGATSLAPAASVGGIGGLGLQAPALSAISPATTAAAGSSLVPTATGGLAATVSPSVQATAPFATATPIADIIPATTASSVSPPSGIGRLFQPDEQTTYENIGSGLKKAFSSGESAMDFLGQNKMNLAMSAAPMLLSAEEEAEIERQRAMIRPYEYQVDNLSGTGVDPFGTEAERLRGRFVAKTPYYAAKGGLMSFAEGGSTSGESSTAAPTPTAQAPAAQTPSSLLINLSPSEAEVYRNIFAAQQMAGLPLSLPSSGIASLPSTFTMSPLASAPAPAAPRPPVAYTPSMVGTTAALDTSEKRYTGTPGTSSVVSGNENPFSNLPLEDTRFMAKAIGKDAVGFRDVMLEEFMRYARNPKAERPEPRRIVGYTDSGQAVYLASDAKGGTASGTSSNKFSYDPATGTYRQLAQGGLTALAEGGMPMLKRGQFLDDATDRSGRSDGMSDSMPATINGTQPARLTDGEFVIPADVVSHLGNGSSKAGAKKLHVMMDRIRKARTGKKKQAPEVKAERFMPA
jgi:hypothetical protein